MSKVNALKVLFLLLLPVRLLAQAQGIPTVGLVSGWTFSGNANDIIGSNHATITSAPLTTDRCGNANSAYSFNGSSNYIRMTTAGPTGTVSRSLSFWARTSNTVINSPRASFCYGNNAGIGDSYEIVWNYCAAGVGLDLSNQAYIKGNNCLLDNQWHHIAIVYNATVSTVYTTVQFYFDGVLQTSLLCNVSGTTATINTNSTWPITIGRASMSAVRYWQGDLDDFFLYDRAISQSEVLQLFNTMTCTPVVSGNTLVCMGSTNTYTVPPVPNGTYTWTLPSGWTGTTTTNTISATAGSFGGIVTVASSNTCFSFPVASTTVSIINPAYLSVTPPTPTICPGGSATLTASGANSYTWSNASNSNSIVVSPNVTTTYTVAGSFSTQCNDLATITVTVVPPPSITVTGSPPLCNGAAVTLTAAGASTYTWLPTSGNNNTLTVSPTSTSVFTVLGSASGCSASATATIPVPPAVSVAVSQNTAGTCIGNTITIQASGSGGQGTLNYSWSPSGSASSMITVAEPNAGSFVYTVMVTDNFSCAATGTTVASFFPGATITVSSHSICPQDTVFAQAGGGSSYFWEPSGSSGNSLQLTNLSPANYTLTGFTAQGCSATATGSLYLKPAPTLSFNTFSITCGSLGSATVNASGGTGPFTYSWIPTGQSGSVAVNMFPGTHTVNVFDTGTGCLFPLTNYFAPLIPLTGTVTSTDSLKCFGASTGLASIALSGGSGSETYLWTGPDTILTTDTAAFLTAGIHTVSVTDALTFCNVTHTFAISEPPAINILLVPSSPSVCVLDTIRIDASISGGTPAYSYSWLPGPASTVHLVWDSIAGINSYSFLVTDSYSCSVIQTIELQYVAYPQLSVAVPTLCPLQPGQIVAGGASTYSWNTGATTSVLNVSVPATTQYTVWGNTAGCTSDSLLTLTIKPAPAPALSSNSPLCKGDTLFLTAAPNHTYSWTGPQQFTSTLAAPLLANIQVAQSGMYQLTVTAANGCTAGASQAVLVHPLPQAIAGGATVCIGQQVNFWGAFFNNTSYYWTGPNSFTSASQSVFLPNATASMTGIYHLTVTNNATGCRSADSAVVNVTTPVPVTFSVNSPVCRGDTVLLLASASDGVFWNGPGVNSNQPAVTLSAFNSPGSYTMTTVQGPCTRDSVFLITLHPDPVATINGANPHLVCHGEQLQLAGSANPPASTYAWSAPTFTSSSPAILVQTVNLSDSGLYALHIIDVNGCAADASVMVRVMTNPVVTAQGATVCAGEPAVLSAEGAFSYQWNGPGGAFFTGPVVSFAIASSTNNGMYHVTGYDSTGCSATDTVMLLANPFPLPLPSVVMHPDRACIGGTVSLTGAGGASYQWTGPSAFSATGSAVQLPLSDVSQAGVYTLSVRNHSNCTSTTTLLINLLPQPLASFGLATDTSCVPFCTSAWIDSSMNAAAPIVHIEAYLDGQNVQDASHRYCVVQPGTHTLELLYRDTNGCTNSARLLVTGLRKPLASFSHHPQEPVAGTDVVRFYESTGCAGCELTWHFADNGETSEARTPEHTFAEEGLYPVVLVVSSNEGCADTLIRTINVLPGYSLYFPDAFTPNNDGINDQFFAKGFGIETFSLAIFDRWGELIFSASSIGEAWNGSFRGSACPTGVYTWKASVHAAHKRHEFTGRVNLVR